MKFLKRVMSLFHQQSQTTITIECPIDQALFAVVDAGRSVGTIIEQNDLANYVVILTPTKLFPPRNAATVRVSAEKITETRTKLTWDSDSLDGLIGFGSAKASIDELISAAGLSRKRHQPFIS
jgi:hypothetical protein